MCRKNTEISFMDAISMTDNFCPIKIYYNNEVVWDDSLFLYGGWSAFDASINNFKMNHPEWEQIMIYKIKIDIVDFHHSIIHFKGKRVKPYEEM